MSVAGASCGCQPSGGAKHSSTDTGHLTPKYECKSRDSLPPIDGPWDLKRGARKGEESSEELSSKTSESKDSAERIGQN